MTETTTTSATTDEALRNARKVREGIVVSNKMNKTIVISIVSECVTRVTRSSFSAPRSCTHTTRPTMHKSVTAFA